LEIPQIAPDRIFANLEELRQLSHFHPLIGLQQVENLNLPFFPKKTHLVCTHKIPTR
jgi:hypothetical protein